MPTSTNPTTYLNFDLLITRAGDAYRVYVVDAPGGDADATFEMPFAPGELGRLVHGSGTRRGLRRSVRLVILSFSATKSMSGK